MGAAVEFASYAKLYECSAKSTFYDWRVDHPLVAKLGKSVVRLKKIFAGLEESPATVDKLSLTAFSICAAPLPLNHPALVSEQERFEIATDIATWGERYGDEIHQHGLAALDALSAIRALSDNPVLDHVYEALTSVHSGSAGSKGDAVLLKTSRLAEPSLQVLQAAGLALQPVSARDLYRERCFDRLVVIGPLRWFRPHKDSEHNPIVTASRASTVHIIRWGWINDAPSQPAFADIKSAKSGVRIHIHRTITGSASEDGFIESVEHAPPETTVESDDLVPTGHTQLTRPGLESIAVRARIFRVGMLGCIALPIAQAWRVVDLSSDRAVRWVKVRAVEPEMALVLGERGQGDYIAEVADRDILRDRATSVRECAAQWREPLRRMLREQSRRWPDAQQQLRAHGGSDVATSLQNVRNWASGIVLGPERFEDFTAVMSLLGMSNRTHDCWRAIVELRRAHAKAGHRVGKLLLRMLQSGVKDRLEREGTQVFELPGLAGRKIGAYRVLEVVAEDTEVDDSQIGRPFRCEEY